MLSYLSHTNLVDFFLPSLNYISRERVDPLISLLGVEHSFLLISCQILILALGSLWLIKELSVEVPSKIEAISFLVIALIFFLGTDSFYLKIHWLPYLLASGIRLTKSKSLVIALGYSLFGFLWILSAGSLAFFGLILVWLSCMYLSNLTDKKVELGLFHISNIILLLLSFLPRRCSPSGWSS